MKNLTLLLIKLAFLAVLWLFVIAAVGVVRTDLFGPSRRRNRAARKARPPRPVPPPAPRRTPSRSNGRSSRAVPQQMVVTGGALAGRVIPLSDMQITIGRADDATL